VLINIPKKGDLSECGNWRGISLLSVPSKVLSRILLRCIQNHIKPQIRREKVGFRTGKSCIELTNTLCIRIKQSVEWQTDLYLLFIDFEKAFNRLDEQNMWSVLRAKSVPGKIISPIKEAYNNCRCRGIHQGSLTEPIQVKSRVRQGCLLSPIIFVSIMDEVMRKVTGNHRRGITWSLHDWLEDLEYADDVCLISQSNRDMKDKLLPRS
jgi:hypothetical protein